MSSYSKTMVEVLEALDRGEDISTVNGRTVRATTIEALETRGAIKLKEGIPQITERGRERVETSISENLQDHRPNRNAFRWIDNHRVATFDIGQCDYIWWDKVRRGAVAGMEIAGAFIKPLASKKAAWVLGQAPQFAFDDPKTGEIINDWFREHHTDILLAMEESAVMADYYIVINPDESITVVPPNVVEPIVNPKDFSQHIGWRITQTYSHPQKPWVTQTIIDEYTYSDRKRTIIDHGGNKDVEKYKNLTGLLPVIHVANNKHGGEMFGHAEAEALVQVLHYYGEVIAAAVEGNIRQGRPTPTFEQLGTAENLEAFMDAFGTEKTKLLPNGKTETFTEVDFSSDRTVFLGDTGKFKYAQPGSFTGDTMNITNLLFYLILQNTEIPEFVWGNAIQGSQASATTQVGPFVKWAEKEQGRAEKWLLPLIMYITALKSLYDRDVKYQADTKPKAKWTPLSEVDGKLTLEAIKIALTVGGWEPEDVVPYMPMDIDNPDEIIAKIMAKKEEARRRQNGEDEPFVNVNDDTEPDEDEPEPENERELLVRALSETHTGVMVAFEIPLDIATNLASSVRQVGLEPVAPEDMHLTLAYLGDMNEIEDMRETLTEYLQILADMRGKPLLGSIGGIGRFNASVNSEGKDVIYASFDAPELPEFRQELVSAIEGAEIKVANDHGFTPHITLAYIDKDEAMPNLALETTEIAFERFNLYWGDERTSFQLTANEREAILA